MGFQRSPLPSRTAASARAKQARVLGPIDFSAVGGRPAAAPTVYLPHQLLIETTRVDERDVLEALAEVGRTDGFRIEKIAGGVRLNPVAPTNGALDSWLVIDQVRRVAGSTIADCLGLDHVLTTAEMIGGNPFAIDHGFPGLDGFGYLAFAGRGPVACEVPEPQPRPGRSGTPRIVLLDTVIGRHPWFERRPVTTSIEFASGKIVRWERKGSLTDGRIVGDPLVGLLATHAGHGMFIAGLVRQTCPEAEIVALEIMGPDGMVSETTLTDALTTIRDKQRDEPGWADAVVLSLGYYAETASDLVYTARIKQVLLDLARHGVAVFCAAGNDRTDRPSYPAAFAADPAFRQPDVVPLVAVRALNPNGSVADFSNDGGWVNGSAVGVNLVSTAPSALNGSARPVATATGFGRPRRASVDPDDFASGFAAWSGTSFAAPVLAGKYLNSLIEVGRSSDVNLRRQLAEALLNHGSAATVDSFS